MMVASSPWDSSWPAAAGPAGSDAPGPLWPRVPQTWSEHPVPFSVAGAASENYPWFGGEPMAALEPSHDSHLDFIQQWQPGEPLPHFPPPAGAESQSPETLALRQMSEIMGPT